MPLDAKTKDELGRTATAPDDRTTPGEPPPPVEETLGRYRLERELGAGGMGVVYQAFDPELERRVALKVLASSRTSPEAHERLLREARAMARLNHPNVVAVYEVGSADGRDFVAMELVEGTTVMDWLREAKRSTDEITAAFIAAGRGLAAAHDAGVIHRDFKPHNVMRDVHGNIAVTDFGLAADVEVVEPAASASRNTPSPLGGLTQTGSILGTPAYMAPEQWKGGSVGPKADQFAFCVALWEALAGERPYSGPVETLRTLVERGPSKLDVSPIPRRLREVVLRGLEPDPDKRWPSMTDVIDKLERARRRNKIKFAVAGALVAAAAAAVIIFAGRGAVAPACAPAALDPASVWPTGELVRLIRNDQAIAGRMMSHDMTAWLDARADACHRDLVKRTPILTCLDGMLAKLDVVRRAVETTKTSRVDPGPFLLDPKLCLADQPPRVAPLSNTARALIGTWLSDYRMRGRTASLDTSLATAFADPCARTIATAFGLPDLNPRGARRDLDDGLLAAEECGDDQLLFMLSLADLDTELEEPLGDKLDEKLEHLQTRLGRVAQPDTEAELERVRAIHAIELGRHDEALAHLNRAIEGFTERGRPRRVLDTRMIIASYDQRRRAPAAVAALPATLDRWRAEAIRELAPDDSALVALEYERAYWRRKLGDITGDHSAVAQLRHVSPNQYSRAVKGRVVDTNHRPVAGATVSAGWDLEGDSLVAALLVWDGDRVTQTDGRGEFQISDASLNGVAIAQLGNQRSRPVVLGDDDLELVLEPTHRIEGKIALDGPAPTVKVAVYPLPLNFDSRVSTWPRADGTFEVDGVLGGKNLVVVWSSGTHQTTYEARIIDVTNPVVHVTFDRMRSQRVVHVILRPAVALEGVEVALLNGRHRSTTLDEVRNKLELVLVKQRVHATAASTAPEAVDSQLRAGDLLATFDHVPDTITSVCALPTPRATAEDPVRERAGKVEMPCTAIAPTADVVVVELPPIPRFE